MNAGDLTERTKGIIAYLLGAVGGVFVLFFIQETSRETRVNAAQSIILGVSYIILLVVLSVFSFLIGSRLLISLLSIGYLALTVLGCINAYNEKEFNIPIVTENALKLFANVIDKK